MSKDGIGLWTTNCVYQLLFSGKFTGDNFEFCMISFGEWYNPFVVGVPEEGQAVFAIGIAERSAENGDEHRE